VIRRSALFGALAVVTSCTEPTSALTTDVDAAWAAWQIDHPAHYSVEFSILTEWSSRSGYYKVTVDDGVLTHFTSEDGTPLPTEHVTATLEWQWEKILSARADGALKKAVFTTTGIPVEWTVDRDNWFDDAVSGWTRNFEKR